MSSKYATE